MSKSSIAVLGKFKPHFRPHQVVQLTLGDAAEALAIDLKYQWVATDRLINEKDVDQILGQFNGIWCSPGSPYKSLAGALNGIWFAREKNIPFIGTCGGFQHLIIEYARNVLGYKDANSIENDPSGKEAFITPLDCSLAGQTLKIRIKENSKARRIWGTSEIAEHYYCNYGINPKYLKTILDSPLNISGVDKDNEPRIVELPGHPFFIGTLFVPGDALLFGLQDFKKAIPHPLIKAFVEASCHSFEYS